MVNCRAAKKRDARGQKKKWFRLSYAAYYYGAHLQEEAFDALQAGLFFGYMLLVSLGVALVAGAAGFLASLKFLAYIFAQIKFD